MRRSDGVTVLGIDPGLARLGYGAVASEHGQLTLKTFGVIETHKALDVGTRLSQLRKGITELITEHHPDRLAVEKLFFSANVKTAMVVSEVRGVILVTAAAFELPVVEFTPLTVKQTITGYGAADKGQLQRMLRVMFRLPTIPQPDDAADALALAVCGAGMAYDHLT